MPTTSAAGTTVEYTVAGSGPGIALVAGTGLPAQGNFGHLVDAFAGSTVVLPDYAGSGQTTAPDDGPLTLDLLAEQIAAAARDAVDGPVDLVGYSLGAMVAATVAAHHPDLVRRLVLVAGWTGPDDARHKLAVDLWLRLERTDHDLFNRFLQLNCLSAPFLSGLGDEGMAGLIAGAPPITPGMRRHMELDLVADVRELLSKISAPTLVVGLTRDQVIPVERARQVHEAIPGSAYAEIDTGHLVMFEQPGLFVETVRGFLR
ncbi:alpha/beta fold hydrolase [Phytohabitans aurantiacus]|uniref:3-oxoadipate enol-lactone hydrolase n=1 Tax=Phytohabitans aurantiacus TaxID=3016789 RepID=A0ABQ5R723_9ACTN|nr:alpha/beta hydrolase [Phytohabitans aurantiacus]GLI02564.1 3-oxoadipate enol-lactone hydrolase [Phytohabitans aurantiacus]